MAALEHLRLHFPGRRYDQPRQLAWLFAQPYKPLDYREQVRQG